MKKVFCTLFAILFCITLAAQETDKTLSPYFMVYTSDKEQHTDVLPLKSTSVTADIVGNIANATVKQQYINTGKSTLEAVYTFPLSTKAAVYAMTMKIGNKTITAKIEEKNKARKDYETARDEGKRASLLEESRPNVFTMNVANILAGDTVEVELKYTEVIVPEDGIYSFICPAVVGPRYTSKAELGHDDNLILEDKDGDNVYKPVNNNNKTFDIPYTKSGVKPSYTFNYKVNIYSPVPITSIVCTSHKVDKKFETVNLANIQLSKGQEYEGNRDVILNYVLRGNSIQEGLSLYEGEDENFFMLMVQPPAKVNANDIPPREYIFIVDVSGSMHGMPLNISKSLIRNLILNLRPTDCFNVLLFSGASELMDSTSITATDNNITKAIDFIDKKHAWGGTEVLDALNKAYAIPRTDQNVSRTFVIITDGYVSVEQEAFEMIRNNSGNTNFFAFGIGSGVNRYLIEGMAFAGNGEPMIITKEEDAAEKAEKFRKYISTPILTNIKVDTKNFEIYDVEPINVPDMMAERPIVLFGKYKSISPKSTISISGKMGKTKYNKTLKVNDYKATPNNMALRYLWARERIKYIDYRLGEISAHHTDTNNADIKELQRLGLKYNLVTKLTSFVAIEEVIANKDGKIETVQQVLPLPEGVSDYAGANKRGFLLMSANNVSEDEEEAIYCIVETQPSYPGGDSAMFDFIKKHLVYPKTAKENNLEGRVFITFVVDVDGSITDIKILRDIGGGCGKEAVRVIKLMPKWIPGTQRGRPVRTQFNLPIVFELDKDSNN